MLFVALVLVTIYSLAEFILDSSYMMARKDKPLVSLSCEVHSQAGCEEILQD